MLLNVTSRELRVPSSELRVTGSAFSPFKANKHASEQAGKLTIKSLLVPDSE